MISEIVEGRIKIELPEKKWISELSREFSDNLFSITSMSLLNENICNILIEIKGKGLGNLTKKLKNHPTISDNAIINDSGSSIMLNIKSKGPVLLSIFNREEIVPIYPIHIQNGWGEWHFFATRERITAIFDDFKAKGINVELKSVGKYKAKNKLSERQLEVLDHAIKEGYFEIPRKITLNNLASKLEIASSTLSELLRRINKKLIVEA